MPRERQEKARRTTGGGRQQDAGDAPLPSGGPARGLWAALIVSLGVAFLCLPLLLHEDLPQGSDVFSTTHYLQGFMKAFSEGDLYPRWTDRSNQQLGGPSFVMFVPVTYYGAGATAWLTGSVISGFKLYILLVSALTGFGLDTLRLELSALLASLWEDVDVRLPYTAGELLARVRERGTIELEYGDHDVHVRGRVAPALAAELRGRAVDGRTESGS